MNKIIYCFVLIFCMCGMCYADQVFCDIAVDTDMTIGFICVGSGVYFLTVGTTASTVGGALLLTAGIRLIFL